MTTVRRITADEFPALRAVRIAALTDSPAAFGSTLDREVAFTDDIVEASAPRRRRRATSGSPCSPGTGRRWSG
ncbi:MAG: hypothetical protein R2713_02390 [Ilumatobacteraceae bacterium]